MKKFLVQFLKLAIPISLGIYLVVTIYKDLDDEQREALFFSFEKANYWWVGLAFLMGLLSHYIRGYRWKFQMEAMGYHTSALNNFMAVMIGYIVNLILPRVGEVSRAASITKFEKIPFQKSFGTILSERALDSIVLLSITGITVILQYSVLESFVKQLSDKFLEKLNSPLVWVLAVLAILAIPVSLFVFRKYRSNSIISKIEELVHGLIEGLRSIFRMEKGWLYVLATIAIWALYVGMFWVGFFALEETAFLPVSAVFAGFVLGSFAVVLVPGGIGAFPVAIMQALIIYGVAGEIGFALGWIIWFSQTLMIVLFGGLSMIYMPIYNKKLSHVATGISEA